MQAVEALAGRISRFNRERKHREFLERLRPGPADRILDVGVNDEEYSPNDNFLEKNYGHREQIVAVSRFGLTSFKARHPAITAVVGDGLRLPFPDRSFAIAYSNAVIEHVGGRENQIAFLKELGRVGRKGYVTTPSRYFPIEVHTRVPLLHLLMSKQRFDRFLALIGKSWASDDYMHLLGRRDLESMLRAAGIRDFEITTKRLLGFPLTYTVTWTR